jgi:hypothetical protein
MDFIMLHDVWLANPERHTSVTWVLCSRHNHCCVPTLNNNLTMRGMTDSELARVGGVIALLALVALGAYIMFGG